jgi:hypothetical protein
MEVPMKKTRNILAWIGAHVAASIVIGGTAYAQFGVGIAPTINNNNLGSTVGINTGGNPATVPPAPFGTACDPLEIGNVGVGGAIGGGPVPALRLSNILGVGACPPNTDFGQLGFETTGGGVFSTLSGNFDIVLANQSQNGGDIIIASRSLTGGAGSGNIRFTTQNAAAVEIERMTIENNGNVGIALPVAQAPQNRLDVEGGMAVGIAYSGTSVAPPSGMIVQGRVGIGTNAPAAAMQLDVTGSANVSNSITIGNNVNAGNDITATNNLVAGNDVTVGANLNFNAASQLFDVTGANGTAGQVLTSVAGQPTWTTLPAAGGGWALAGSPSVAGNVLGSTTMDLPIIAAGTTWIYVDNPNGVAIGNGVSSAAAALDVTGDVQFSDRLMPGGMAGTSGYLLQSNGSLPGATPTWVSPTTVVGSSAWTLSGNSAAAANFVGTTNNVGLSLKAFNAEMIKLNSSGISGTVGQIVIGGGGPSGTKILTITGSTQITGATDISGATNIVGNTTVTGNFSVISDARLKENVITLDNALSKVMALRGVSYDFRTSETPELNLPKTHQIGFISQEVEQVVPEVVNETSSGHKAIAYQNLVALLVESTKEQQSIIESQRATIDNLSARLARLEALVDPSSKPVTPSVKEEGESIQLEQNTPNPFDRTTIIRYMVPTSIGSAEMVIFEAGTGREVERFIIANRGEGEVTVSVAGLASGSYVYAILADGKLAQTRTMVVAR